MELTSVFGPVAAEMRRVEEELARLVARLGEEGSAAARASDVLGPIVSHPFAVPGKRIRPALVLLSAGAAGGRPGEERFVSLAAAVELLHAASLAHDDVLDDAETRRLRQTVNRLFGTKLAVLAGDMLYTRFFSTLVALPGVPIETRMRLLATFLATTGAMCTGEIIAHAASLAGQPLDLEQYREIAEDKTAVLFAACCSTAAVVAGAPEAQVREMEGYGRSFGLLFQAVDDLDDRDARVDSAVSLPDVARLSAAAARDRLLRIPAGRHRDALGSLVDLLAERVET
jgi:geranylgeranyl pyrophosphate synthase